jgi:hypothetical protein
MSAENPQPQTAGEFTATAFNSLTLRDYFAAKAMQARLINLGYHTHSGRDMEAAMKEMRKCHRESARHAYEIADAMLAERERSK